MTNTGHWNKQRYSQMWYYLFCEKALNILSSSVTQSHMKNWNSHSFCYKSVTKWLYKLTWKWPCSSCLKFNFTTSRKDDWQSCLNTHINLPCVQESLIRACYSAYTCPSILEAYFVVLLWAWIFFSPSQLWEYNCYTFRQISGKTLKVYQFSSNVCCLSSSTHWTKPEHRQTNICILLTKSRLLATFKPLPGNFPVYMEAGAIAFPLAAGSFRTPALVETMQSIILHALDFS